MKYYEVTLGVNAAHEQNTLMARFKTAGAEVIQSSSGLVVKTAGSIRDLLGEDLSGLSCKSIESGSIETYSKDVQAFLKNS